MDVLNHLSLTLNFTARIYKRKDGVWGMPSNETANGLIGNIFRNEADLAAAALAIGCPRCEVMDFLQPISHFRGGIYINKVAVDEDYDFTSYFEPFDRISWVLLSGTAVILGICSVGLISANTSTFNIQV